MHAFAIALPGAVIWPDWGFRAFRGAVDANFVPRLTTELCVSSKQNKGQTNL